jgi:protease I
MAASIEDRSRLLPARDRTHAHRPVAWRSRGLHCSRSTHGWGRTPACASSSPVAAHRYPKEKDMSANPDALQGKRIAILVTEGFEQIELTGPKQALEQAGAKTEIISQQRGKVQGFQHHDRGEQFDAALSFDEAVADNYDGVLLPGGVINGDQLRVIPKAQHFVRQIDAAGKPVFVICHGGWLLVSAGLVKGRTMTSWPTLQDDIRNAGGDWLDQETVVDGNWVSSRKPDDIPAFNDRMLQMLRQGPDAGAQAGEQQGIGLAG